MIRFGVLGPAMAWLDGRRLDLGTPQQRTLFALLLLQRNEFVTTDRMVDVLWPSGAPANAVQVVRTYVSRLRSGGLAGSTLITRRHGYELRVEAGAVDAERLESLAAAARGELDAGRADRADALLTEALALVRGPPLPELADDAGARAERDRLQELCAAAAEDLVEVRLAQGRHRELVPALRAAVAAEPLRERAWGQLMVALYRSGRQAEALALYREARRALVERLGLEPGPQLRGLERMILLHDASLELAPASRLPRYGTSFLGRDAELAAVTAGLHTHRLVTIAGPAGAGKTRLAAEVAVRAGTARGRRVWWVDLDPIGPSRLVATVARALDVPEVPGRSAVDLAIARLRETSALLVLDNCEHVLGDAARLAARLLDAAPDVRILATSREPLHLDAEAVHRLAGLPVPPSGDAAVQDYPAAQLFLERAGPARVAGEEAAVATLVGRLDGLPLAIELAAGRLDALSATELAQALGERLSLLGGGTPAAPARQRTLETAIAWSHDLVSATERRVLRRISIFPASFDAGAAEAVAAGDGVDPGAVLPALARLVSASLLVADRRGPATRYRLLLTVRAFARGRLREAGELERAARRHRDAYVALAEQVGRDALGARVEEALRRGRPEHENFQVALRWSLDRDEWDTALRLAASLSPYWFRIGFVRDGRELLEQAVRHAASDDPWRPLALVGQAMLAHAAGAGDALQVADEAVAASSAAGGDPERLAIALIWRARALLAADRLADARSDLARASTLAATAESEEGLAFADQVRGCVQLQAGDLDGAAALLVRARDRYRVLRGGLDAGYTLIDLARVRLAQGRGDEALQVAGEALTDFRRRGDPRGIAQAFACLGRAHVRLGELERGRTALDEALRLAHRWGLAAETADVERALANLPASGHGDEPAQEPALRSGVEALAEERAVAVGDVLREQRDGEVGVAEELR